MRPQYGHARAERRPPFLLEATFRSPWMPYIAAEYTRLLYVLAKNRSIYTVGYICHCVHEFCNVWCDDVVLVPMLALLFEQHYALVVHFFTKATLSQSSSCSHISRAGTALS